MTLKARVTKLENGGVIDFTAVAEALNSVAAKMGHEPPFDLRPGEKLLGCVEDYQRMLMTGKELVERDKEELRIKSMSDDELIGLATRVFGGNSNNTT